MTSYSERDRPLAVVSAEIRDLTKALNAAMSEGVTMHGLRIDITEDRMITPYGAIPRLRVEQFKRVEGS